MLDPRWTKIMQEVDRLYHINQTSEGRINWITDYIICLLNKTAQQNRPTKHLFCPDFGWLEAAENRVQLSKTITASSLTKETENDNKS